MRRAAMALALCAAATAILVVVGWPAGQYRDNDYLGFWAGSRSLLEGRDPYDVGTWMDLHNRVGSRGLAIVPPATGFGYPLTTAIVFAPFALLPISVAAPLWLVAQAALALVALIYLARRLFPATLRRDLPVLVALVASSQPAWVLAAGGNLGGFLLAIAAGTLALLLDGRPLIAGAVAGFAVVKPHPFLWAVPLILLALPRAAAIRLAAGAVGVGAGLAAISFALRPGWVSEWLVSVTRIEGAPAARATVFGILPPDARALGWLIGLAAALAFAVWARRRRPTELVVAAALPLSVFATPYAWSYDHSILFVTAAVVVALAASVRAAARAMILVLLTLATIALPWVLYVVAFRRGDEAWTAAVPLTVMGVLAIASRQKRTTD